MVPPNLENIHTAISILHSTKRDMRHGLGDRDCNGIGRASGRDSGGYHAIFSPRHRQGLHVSSCPTPHAPRLGGSAPDP